MLKIPIHLKNENLNILHILCLCVCVCLQHFLDVYFISGFVHFALKKIAGHFFVPEIPAAANNKKYK